MTAAALSLGRIGDRRWLAGVPILFLVVFSSLPVVIFLSRALADPEPTLEHLKALFSTDLYFLQLWNTIRIAAVVTALSILLGYPLASLAATAAPRRQAASTGRTTSSTTSFHRSWGSSKRGGAGGAAAAAAAAGAAA